MMALVHDLAEAQGRYHDHNCIAQSYFEIGVVGDIAPRENIPKAEKRRLEAVKSAILIFLAAYAHRTHEQRFTGGNGKLCTRDVTR